MKKIKTFTLGLVAILSLTPIPRASALDLAQLDASVDTNRAARYEIFENFKIKGICGDVRLDLATSWGANTIRTYTPPSRKQLDQFQGMGLKVVVGIWMPHQGENPGKAHWNYDYNKGGDEQVKSFAKLVDQIGDHPAILMWCLGNEVPLVPAYLETVNRMSELLHKKYPKQLTSVTIINAPKEGIEAIKKYAPDVDVIGANCYGAGAVNNASKRFEQDWGRAYYISELGPQGPWWGNKTAWGEIYEQTYDAKLQDLRHSFQIIDNGPRCIGSAVFLWGYWSQQKPTYFSAFLVPENEHAKQNENELYITPMAEECGRYWSGRYPEQRGPVLTKIKIEGQAGQRDPVVFAGKPFKVTATVTNFAGANSQLKYRWWILDKAGDTVFGPLNSTQPAAEITAPKKPDTSYVVMGYVIADNQRASGFTVPINVVDTAPQPTMSSPNTK
jgi:hypothetical protein